MARFTDRELDVMAVLWERGDATVAEVQQRLSDELAYTTVLTVLRTLEEKGHVGTGRGASVPVPAAGGAGGGGRDGSDAAAGPRIRGIGGASATQLVSDRQLGEEELERMRRLLDERLEEGS